MRYYNPERTCVNCRLLFPVSEETAAVRQATYIYGRVRKGSEMEPFILISQSVLADVTSWLEIWKERTARGS